MSRDLKLLAFRGKPVALSSSFTSSTVNPLSPSSQQVPLTSAGFLHPSHAANAQFQLAHQSGGVEGGAGSQEQDENTSKQSEQQQTQQEDEEMEM